MIDHVSIAVRDLKAAGRFYERLLATLGLTKLREWPDAAIGFGKKYPEFWINLRADMKPAAATSGTWLSAGGILGIVRLTVALTNTQYPVFACMLVGATYRLLAASQA